MADLSRSSVGRWVSVSLATLTFAGLAGAMDPNRAWSQYTRDRWSLEQGFPGGSIYAITETADGYLWIGAEKGLVRFDGLNFRLFNHATTATLPEGPVLDLAASADGDLWLRMQVPSVVRYHAGIFEDVSQTLGQIDNPVTAIFRRDNGDLLLAAIDNKILKYGSGRLTRREFTTQHPNFFVDSLAETGDGTLWLGTRDSGLFSMSKAGASPVPQGLHERRINSLLRNGEQELWIGSDGGLVRWDGTRTTDEGVAEALKHVQILSMTRDRDANIWVGTAKGLARISSSGATSLDDRAAMPVMAVFEDREGNLWSGGTQGIERFRDSLFLTYSTATSRPENNGPLYVDEAGRTWFAPSDGGLYWLKGTEIKPVAIAGLNHDLVYSIAGSGGELWVARQRGGLTHLVEGHGSFRATTYTRKDGLAQDTVYTVYRSRDGSVWAGTLSSGVSRLRNGRFTTYTTANGLASDSISSILEGTDGTMWFATANGLNAFSGDRWSVYAGGQGLPSGHLNCLLEDSNGVLWIGTSAGIAFLRSGRVEVPGMGPDSLHEEILGLTEDADGWLWITTTGHVLRVNRDKLLSGSLSEGDSREYGSQDGLAATDGVKRDRTVIADSHGRIWFSMNRGISVVDPARLIHTPAPAIVHIQNISADANPVDLTRAVRISASSERIIFTYTALSLSAPDRVKYRYMLSGLDHAWSAPTTATEAGYSNLRPGQYRFRVMASSLDGLWNGQEAATALEIAPMFWQTWWFYLAVAMACGSVILALYRHRMRQLTWQLNLRFDERLAERTRIAQELHDTLLQGFLSASMQFHVAMDRLPPDSPARPALGNVLELMNQVIGEGRNTVQGLRSSYSGPPDLVHAFSAITGEFAVPAEVGFRVIIEGQPRPLHPVLRDEVYRIGREALVNAFRHAQATSIEVELEYTAKGLRMYVRDNGRGIDPLVLRAGRDGHWGLPGMRERAERTGAQLHVFSSAESGTEVELFVPSHLAFRSAKPQAPDRARRWLSRYTRGPWTSGKLEPEVPKTSREK